jgi:hypothetical protein
MKEDRSWRFREPPEGAGRLVASARHEREISTSVISAAMGRSLAAGLALMLLAVGAPTLHEHRADTPSLYDEDCPLAQLGAGGIQAGPCRVVDLVAVLAPVEMALAATPRDASEVSRLPFGPRGPPIAV